MLREQENITAATESFSHKLKLFFLPHPKNNYIPHSLHPRRLAFYGLAALCFKIIFAATVFALPYTAWLSDDFFAAKKNSLAGEINRIRKEASLQPLYPDPLLSQAAFVRAQDLLEAMEASDLKARGLSESLRAVGYDYAQAQEFIAVNFDDPQSALAQWKKEKNSNGSILSADFRQIGIGITYSFRTNAEIAVVILAARSQDVQNSRIENRHSEQAGCQRPIAVAFPGGSAASGSKTHYADLKPEIIGWPESFTTKQGDQQVRIRAPYSSRVMLYVDDREIMLADITAAGADSKAVCSGDEIYYQLSLAEGQHSVLAKAIYPDAEVYSVNYLVGVDNSPPLMDSARTSIREVPIGGKSSIIEARISLSSDTAEANLLIGNYSIPLKKDDSDQNIWKGQLAVDDEDLSLFGRIKRSIVVTASDLAGNKMDQVLAQADGHLSIAKSVGEYFTLKTYQPKSLKALLLPVNFLLQAFFVITLVLLIFNIFIEIHEQRLHIIFSTIGLIAILILLISI